MKKNKEYEISIVDTEFPGLGIACLEDKKIYVKGAAPGQTVLARISKLRKEYAEAKLLEILEPSEGTVEVKCSNFGVCGGCSHQYLNYDKQLELKEKQVIKLLDAAGIKDYDFLGIEKSPEEYEYRNKMEFTFGDAEKGGELTLGMHIKNKSFGIVNTDICVIVDEDFRTIQSAVVGYYRNLNFDYYRVMRHEGFLRNLVIRKGKNTDEILVNLVTTSQDKLESKQFLAMLLALTLKGKLIGVLHTINDSLSDVVQADKINVLYGKSYIMEEVLGLKFKISPFSFFQTNTKGAEKLYSIALDFAGNLHCKTVFDLYCGTGTIGQIAASKAKKVIGIELVEEAIDAAKENAKLNNIDNCNFIAGDVAKVITEITDKPDVIILDPPRPGVHPKAMEYVIKFDAPLIVYVSCNPKTLAVDLQKLVAHGYVVEKVKVMDMFPHTPHVETVVRLKRKVVATH